jgi:hypothetical protein
MVIALGVFVFCLFYAFMGLLVYSIRERQHYYSTGKRYRDLYQDEIKKIDEKIKYWRDKSKDSHTDWIIRNNLKDKKKLEEGGFWRISEVRTSLNWSYYWPFFGGWTSLCWLFLKLWAGLSKAVLWIVRGAKILYLFMKNRAVDFAKWFNGKVVGEDFEPAESLKKRPGNYRKNYD